MGAAKRVIFFTEKQIAKKYMRHASQLGIKGNYNKVNANYFSGKVVSHVKNPRTKLISGTHRGTIRVKHYYNPATGVNVMTYPNGEFHSVWKLSTDQIKSLYRTGNIQ